MGHKTESRIRATQGHICAALAGCAPATGGGVFNTAVALGRMGVQAGYFSGLSDDLFGDMLRRDW